ncbi:MAG TPA: hypothetical protein GXZ95_04540 [Mollicutes bacterium]|nr:hypothetical protein [Mollicutes bacterium]
MENKESLCFIDSNRNDKFSCLRGIDLQELIVQIENFYLSYREKLNLPENVSFGLELEYEGLSEKHADKYIRKHFPDWESKTDLSLIVGGEIISPVLHDEPNRWEELQKICNYLKKKDVNTFKNAGGIFMLVLTPWVTM